MEYLGQIARRSPGDCVRDLVFKPRSLDQRSSISARRRGRQRTEWTKEVLKDCAEAAGSLPNLEYYFDGTRKAESAWRKAVQTYVYSH